MWLYRTSAQGCMVFTETAQLGICAKAAKARACLCPCDTIYNDRWGSGEPTGQFSSQRIAKSHLRRAAGQGPELTLSAWASSLPGCAVKTLLEDDSHASSRDGH